MGEADDIRDELQVAGLARADAYRQAAEAMANLTYLLRQGKQIGMSVTSMAEAAGVSRETVYQALRSADPNPPPHSGVSP